MPACSLGAEVSAPTRAERIASLQRYLKTGRGLQSYATLVAELRFLLDELAAADAREQLLRKHCDDFIAKHEEGKYWEIEPFFSVDDILAIIGDKP